MVTATETPEKETSEIPNPVFTVISDTSKFTAVRKTQENPLIEALVEAAKEGKSIFYPGGEEEKLNSLYEAARRRHMSCSLKKGEMDGVLGYLITFTKVKDDSTNGTK